ncbi:S8 family serine peptidase [Streptomyces sp. NPDC053728]|uniref:S8 family peptidase n=1 Tax=Streptomyces sp. NPDC053728 TaxID=3155534 RepID=UPI00343ED76B
MRPISSGRLLPVAIALSMALTGWTGVAAASAQPAASPASGATPSGKSYDITLVTGDLVHYTDRPGAHDVVTVDPADGNSGGVQVRTYGDDTYVVPVDAMPLLAAGKLDPRLFNVSQLVAMGYDDAHTDAVPLIATASPSARSARPPAAPAGASADRSLTSIHATALHTEKDRARTFWKSVAPGSAPRQLPDSIGKLWLDGRVRASLANETSQIKATDAWQKGYDGTGVKVAVLDTGADLDHPDLVGQVADIVSMSLGTPAGSDGSDPMSQAVNTSSANGGPLFVIAAGNTYSPETIGAPGAATAALTIGAVDKNDRRAEFSSQGPLTGTHRLKPDVSAPGVDVTAAASQSVAGWTGGLYRTMSGTSMATPLVAGTAAILKQRHPDWSGERIKNALMSTSHKTTETPYEVGTGRVDAAAAVDSTIEATGSVPAATYNWPHADAKATTRTVTYRNDGDADATLGLALDTDDPAYSLSASSVTVPADGTAEVTLTLDPSKVPVDTTFSGQVVATDTASGAVVAHTGFALFKEREMYDYTIKAIGRDGKPAADTVVLNSPGSTDPTYINVDGETTVRLAPGDYTAWSSMDVTDKTSDSLGRALLIAPNATLDAAQPKATAVLDASKAHKAYAVPERESETSQAVIDFSRAYDGTPVTSGRNWNSAFMLSSRYDSVYLAPTGKVSKGTLDVFVHWRMREKALDARTGTGQDIALLSQGGSTFHDGTRTLKTVYAGTGTPAEYAHIDARGKAVVVAHSADVTAAGRAQAASAAGAAMLIVVNDTNGRLYERLTGVADLTVASVMRNSGTRFVAEAKSGKGKLHVSQKQYPDYTYDLLQSYRGSVPDHSLVYRPSDRDLARVDSSYYAAAGTLGQGSRYFVPSWGPALGGDEYERFGRTVTEFVTQAPSDLGFWYEQHAGTSGDAAGWYEQNDEAHYTAGRRYDNDWFKPVQAPRLDSAYAAFASVSGTLQWNIPMWSGGDDSHTGFGGTGFRTVLTRADGTQVAAVNSRAGRASNLPAGSYTLTATGQRSNTTWPTSTRTSTAWGFDFTRPAARADVPLLNVGYSLDTDLQGLARAGKTLDLGSARPRSPVTSRRTQRRSRSRTTRARPGRTRTCTAAVTAAGRPTCARRAPRTRCPCASPRRRRADSPSSRK